MTKRRKVGEWVGRTPDTPRPPKVLERLWEACGGKCQGCGLDLRDQAWDEDHIVALVNWVPTTEAPHGNRESNLQVLGLKCCHRPKTKEDVKIKWRTSRYVRSHTGIKSKTTRHIVPGSKRSPWKKAYNKATGRWETVRRTG